MFSKVMLGSDHPEFGLGQKFADEGITRLDALASLLLAVDYSE